MYRVYFRGCSPLGNWLSPYVWTCPPPWICISPLLKFAAMGLPRLEQNPEEINPASTCTMCIHTCMCTHITDWRDGVEEGGKIYLLCFHSCTSIVARKTGRIVLGTPSKSQGRVSSDESVLEGRAASTPQGNEYKLACVGTSNFYNNNI